MGKPTKDMFDPKHFLARGKRSSNFTRTSTWGCQMDLSLEDLHHRLDQLRFLATQTDDPLAEPLVRDLIVELEELTAAPSPVKHSLA